MDENILEPISLTTYAEDWMQYWVKQGYHEIDIPIRKSTELGFLPLVLDVPQYLDAPEPTESEQALHALWEAQTEGGCRRVYGHQLFQGYSGRGAMGLVSENLSGKDFAKLTEEHGAMLSSLIHIGHSRLSAHLMGQTNDKYLKLSPRQRDVLRCLFQGLKYKQIAYQLCIDENTVAYHIAQIKKKLECKTSRDILIKSYQLGILESL